MLTDGFPAKAASIVDAVKASGADIRLPGERSSEIARQRRLSGELPIPLAIWESITATAEHGLPSEA